MQYRKIEGMEKLMVDAEGKIMIPVHSLEKHGLHHSDELILIEVSEGLLIYQHGIDSLTVRWWNNLSEDERRPAEAAAQCYGNLSVEARDHIRGEGVKAIRAEGDESELPAK